MSHQVQVKLGNDRTCRKVYDQKRAIPSKTCESSGSEAVPYIHEFPSWRCTMVYCSTPCHACKGCRKLPVHYLHLPPTYSKQASVSAWRLQSIPSRQWIRDNHSTNGGLVGNWKNTSYFCCKPSARSRQPCSTSKILPSHRGSSSAGKPHSCRDSDFRCYNWSVHGVATAKHTSQTFKTPRPATETHENPLSKTHPKLTKTVLAKPSFTTSSLHSCMCNLPFACPPKLEPLFISGFQVPRQEGQDMPTKKKHQLRTIRFDHLPKSTKKKGPPKVATSPCQQLEVGATSACHGSRSWKPTGCRWRNHPRSGNHHHNSKHSKKVLHKCQNQKPKPILLVNCSRYFLEGLPYTVATICRFTVGSEVGMDMSQPWH